MEMCPITRAHCRQQIAKIKSKKKYYWNISPKPAQTQAFFTFILPNSNWKTLGLVAWANTAGNNFVLGST